MLAHKSGVQLRKIVIPAFSGKYVKWPIFYDLCKSLIHNNTSLADVQKLLYLKSHLSGEAEQLLRNIAITDAKLWRLLAIIEISV